MTVIVVLGLVRLVGPQNKNRHIPLGCEAEFGFGCRWAVTIKAQFGFGFNLKPEFFFFEKLKPELKEIKISF